MKKLISTALIGITLLSTTAFLFGCGGGGKPGDVSEKYYNYGLKALEIIDSYLDYEISTEEAYSKLNDLTDRKRSLGDYVHDKDLHVVIYVSSAELEVSEIERGVWSASLDELIEDRNNIAEAVGAKKR